MSKLSKPTLGAFITNSPASVHKGRKRKANTELSPGTLDTLLDTLTDREQTDETMRILSTVPQRLLWTGAVLNASNTAHPRPRHSLRNASHNPGFCVAFVGKIRGEPILICGVKAMAHAIQADIVRFDHFTQIGDHLQELAKQSPDPGAQPLPPPPHAPLSLRYLGRCMIACCVADAYYAYLDALDAKRTRRYLPYVADVGDFHVMVLETWANEFLGQGAFIGINKKEEDIVRALRKNEEPDTIVALILHLPDGNGGGHWTSIIIVRSHSHSACASRRRSPKLPPKLPSSLPALSLLLFLAIIPVAIPCLHQPREVTSRIGSPTAALGSWTT